MIYLFRAALLLQDVFYVYREHVFDKLIARTEKRDGKMFLHEGEYEPLSGQPTDPDLLYDFPSAMISDSQDKKSILTHLAAEDAASWMYDLVK
jgi:hypothetical protein